MQFLGNFQISLAPYCLLNRNRINMITNPAAHLIITTVISLKLSSFAKSQIRGLLLRRRFCNMACQGRTLGEFASSVETKKNGESCVTCWWQIFISWDFWNMSVTGHSSSKVARVGNKVMIYRISHPKLMKSVIAERSWTKSVGVREHKISCLVISKVVSYRCLHLLAHCNLCYIRKIKDVGRVDD